MSTITQAFVQQWDTAIRMEAAQRDSRFMAAVTDRGSITGESFSINFLGDDGSLLDANTVRHGDTEWSLADHSTPIVNMADFYKAFPLDRNDIPKMLVNPVTGGDYMQLLMNAKNRRIDDIIYKAARGNQLKKDGTSEALPAGQKIAVGGTGFTKTKLIQAKALFRLNEADEMAGEELYIAYDSLMLEDILADTTLTSADFMAVKMLQEGSVSGKWMGFKWLAYNGIERTGGTSYTIAWAKSGIHCGKGYEEGNVTRRGDKKDAWQVSMGASYGAGRQDKKKVVEIAFV
ncbi:phage capsid protein [Hydrogenophaga sp.]|uniref:phage capsid protein n=1 Tax=Hydrogenophaga sp. TaxID=1904254 RepID=UPI00273027AA|nr:phage capsid protein [Hydrogenophaga sp.]MDP2074630.1 phage capsid protein [Hydrogenophaga sp.]MDP3106401.1 phage capsid protein [Hydrogenophaga sp.]